ncbi:MAG: carboxypeptidase-like regulatory domain-containing protein [Marinoscillum sp.]
MKRLILLISMFICIQAHAQSIKGVVMDKEANEPLSFTNIGVKGKSTGTISNVEGRFILDQTGLSDLDTVVFSYIGFQTVKKTVAELKEPEELAVNMNPSTMNLSEVSIYSGEIDVKDILEQVRENFNKNHPKPMGKQRIFLHKYEETPFRDRNQIDIKKSNFEGLDEQTANEFIAMLPDKFTEYQDIIVDVYRTTGERKLVPIDAVSLEEDSQKNLVKDIEEKMSSFFKDIESTREEEGVYYKFRTGIFAFKDDGEVHHDTVEVEGKSDSLNLNFPASKDMIQGRMDFLTGEYASINSDNWEFINKPGKYRYKLGELTVYLDELVYPISFEPRNGGLFSGTMYISAMNYAVIRLDFQYGAGKSSENFHLLGIGHSIKNKEGHVIFERTDKGYFVKYIYASEREVGSVDRSFSIMKKQKRFLWDKELNEIKMDVSLKFDTEVFYEFLVLNREEVGADVISQITEPKSIEFRKEYSYSASMWNDRTVIAPTAELKKYQRVD